MTDASATKPQALNPLQELQRNFSTFSSMFQALIGSYQSLPIEDNIKFITIHSMNEKYSVTEKLVQQVALKMSPPKEDKTEQSQNNAPAE